MDWSIPQTFYPIALPVAAQWLLFGLACLGTAAGIRHAIKGGGTRRGLVLAIPIAFGMLLASMVVGMVVTFFVHDL